MKDAIWALFAGGLFIFVALGATILARLPLSTSMVYLFAGAAMSPWGAGLMEADVSRNTVLIEHICEVVVLVSLFSSGLKMSPALRDRRWVLPFRLALGSMVITVLLVALAARLLLHLPWGACILLGGMLAPTDPVLASDVQVNDAMDRDRLRFALTGEGGLNDGTAFPFVLLGLALLMGGDGGQQGWRWVAVDLGWSPLAGLAIGAILGLALSRLVLYLRREHGEAVGLDDFVALGLIGTAYGAALLAHANGFLAVFAAGVAVRHLEQSESHGKVSRDAAERATSHPDLSVADAIAVDPQHAPAYMAQAVLSFNEQMERIGEFAVVVTIGALLWSVPWHAAAWVMVPVLFFVVRPAAVALGMWDSASSTGQRWLIAWFGIRGVGSMYYLMYAVNHGLPRSVADVLIATTVAIIVVSIVIHGISVTPLMAAYERATRRRRNR